MTDNRLSECTQNNVVRRRAIIALAVVAVVISVAMTANAVPDVWRKAFDDSAQAVAAAVAVAACWRARRMNDGRSRMGWSVLGVGLSAWLLGQVYWIVIEVVLRRTVATPSLADVGFIVAIPLQAVGLLMVSFPSSRSIERLRTALDGILIVTSLWLITYLLVLKSLIHHSHSTGLAMAGWVQASSIRWATSC